MRRIGGFLAVGAVALAASGCSTAFIGVRLSPCSAVQAHAYRTTSLFGVRQRVAAVQSRYSASAKYTGPIREADGWKSAASGECRYPTGWQ